MSVSKRTVRMVLAALNQPDRCQEEGRKRMWAEATFSPRIVTGISSLFPHRVGVLDGIGAVNFRGCLPVWLTRKYCWSNGMATAQSPIRSGPR